MNKTKKIFTKMITSGYLENVLSILTGYFLLLFFSVFGVFFVFTKNYPAADYNLLTNNFLATNIVELMGAVFILHMGIEMFRTIIEYFTKIDMGGYFTLRRNESDPN